MDYENITNKDLDEIKIDMLDWKKHSSLYKNTDWIIDQTKRDLMVTRYLIDQDIADEHFSFYSTIFYILMCRHWKKPGYWGEVGIEGMNMTS